MLGPIRRGYTAVTRSLGAPRSEQVVAEQVLQRRPVEIEGVLQRAQALLGEIDRRIPGGAASCAVRIDGRFELVRARSVPRPTT